MVSGGLGFDRTLPSTPYEPVSPPSLGNRRKLAVMPHLTRILCVLALAAVATAPPIHGDGPIKPRIRAITGFITIDAKSYASQMQEAVTFLSQVRDAVKAAGYDVAGIRISTQPSPDYSRGLSRADAAAVLRGINDLAAMLRFAPNVGPAMVRDTDDTASIDLITDALPQPGNRLNANIIVAGE